MALLIPLLLLILFIISLLYLVFPFLLLLYRQHHSPLRLLNGPPSPSFFLGNLEQIHDQENTGLLAAWSARYGSTFVYRGFVGGCRLMTTDPKAIAHILGHAYDYPKPDFVRDSLATMAAGHHGLLTVEGDDHRRQRKILAPAFTTSHIKSLTPIFCEKAVQLRDIWLARAEQEDPDSTDPQAPGKPIDVLAWLGRATLDVIGLAGFGYAFNSLSSTSPADNELAHAFSIIFSTARKFRVITILQVWFPFLRRFRRNSATMLHAHSTMRRMGLQLIHDRREEVLTGFQAQNERGEADVRARDETEGEDQIQDDKMTLGRDLLTVLIRSNFAQSAHTSMSTDEVLSQISTFLAAGHETTASALTWCLYALARDRTGVQTTLRRALHALGNEQVREKDDRGGDGGATLAERIARCEYLDWVVRESLRVHAPVTSTMRVCMRDADTIPVSGEGYLDRGGRRRWSIRVKKWDIVTIPIQAINKSEELWGADAAEFRPERWACPPQSARAIPGLHAHTLTFLNGNGTMLEGNRACIGYRFALTEIKIFLYILLKDIEFSIDPALVVEKKVNVVTRPFVKSAPHLGNQLPLCIRRVPAPVFGSSSISSSGEHTPPPPYEPASTLPLPSTT